MLADRLLSRCPACGSDMTLADVTGTTELDESLLSVGLLCPGCSLSAHMRVLKVLWQQILGVQKVADVRQEPEGRRIGQKVAAFREVELAAVDSLEDILWVWEYQEKVRPESVPVEV